MMSHVLVFLFALHLLASAASAQPVTPEMLREEPYLFIPPGFDQPGEPRWAQGAETAEVRIVVRDAATGKVTPCRMNVVGPDGNFYQPVANRLAPYALTGQWPTPGSWGNRAGKAPYRYIGRFFYTTGETSVRVPAGPIRVEVWKGLEFSPARVDVRVAAGASKAVNVKLERTVPMAPEGYYAGDSHLHLNRLNQEDDRILFDLLEAEDFRYGYVLTYNNPPGPYAAVMSTLEFPQTAIGAKTIRSRGDYHIMSGQEYRSRYFGHLNLYLRKELVEPGERYDLDDRAGYGKVGRETIDMGGFAFMAHGGYAQGIWADAALGNVNAVELLQFGLYRGIELKGWYDMLNSGYRFAAQGASDYPPCRTLADCRTYVHHSGSAPTAEEWLAGVAAGRSFFTTGPLLLLEIGGEKPGARINRAGAGPHLIKARVRARCEVTPVTNVELIVNGRVVHQRTVSREEAQGRWIELEHELALDQSAWVAARAWSVSPRNQPDAESHTNPVFVYVNDRAPYQQASLDDWVARIDQQIAVHTKRNFPARPQALDYLQKARDLLMRIRADGGLAADVEPARLAAGLDVNRPGLRNLAADGSLADPTEEEIKAFLRPVPPKPPAEALATFETVGGLQMQLVAAEPLVRDPVAAAFDEDGNLYVAELIDYPYNTNQPVRVAWQEKRPPSDGTPLGRVRVLRDTDGDGRFDESHVFADGLLWAAGIAPWKGGVYVTAPPDIWYLKDTDGDFKADIRERVFTGFGVQNQQGMVNTLLFGLDHKIYASVSANGAGLIHEALAKLGETAVRVKMARRS